jgi:UDP-glucose 6-dehydrogenase
MSAEDPLALARSEWQRKHGIADGDPMIAVLDLVRLAVLHPPKKDAAASLPPTFEEFRATMETLDSRSKVFATQSTVLIAELRTFARTVQRLNDGRAAMNILMHILGIAVGVGVGWLLWKSNLPLL